MGLRLIIEDDEGATTIVPLAGEAVTIGRQDGNTIQLTEKNVSRQHARLTQNETGWVVEDLNSYNGVKVNGVPIEQVVALQEGDVVQIGDYHLALSDDVEKKTLNIERARAANSQVEEPLMVSSSANLPQLSPEELAELQRERDQGGAAAAALASGAVPALSNTPISDDDFEADSASGGSGKFVIIALLLVGGLGFAGWKFLGQKDSAAAANDTIAAVEDDTSAGDSAAAAEANAAAATPDAQPDPQAEETAGATAEEPEPEPEPEVEVEPEVEPEPEPAAQETDRRRNKKKTRPKAGKPAPSPSPEPAPTTPPPPPKDPKQLLADARKAQLKGDNATAYALAKESYGVQRSSDAAKVMGVAACKMGDAAKAKSAYKKLSGANKENLAKVCGANGITL